MKIRTFFLLGISALLLGAILGCASGGSVVPMGDATGTATGTSPGFGGDVSVTITMEKGYITNVVATGKGESSTVGGPALLRLPNSVKKYNTAKVDTISGATISSMAFITAAQEAVDKIVAGK